MNFSVYNLKGKEVSKMEVSDALFDKEVNKHLLYLAVKAHLAGLRAGTASTKTRSEVRGGGKKPWKQKGTGNARMGSLRTPLRRGGGVVFGPKPRKYDQLLTKKMKKAALRSALTARKENIFILDNFEMSSNKTKDFITVMKNFKAVDNKILLIDALDNNKLQLASQNVANVLLVKTTRLNVYNVLNSEKIFVTVSAVKKLEEAIQVGK